MVSMEFDDGEKFSRVKTPKPSDVELTVFITDDLFDEGLTLESSALVHNQRRVIELDQP